MNAIWQVHSDATPLLDETEAGVLGVTRADPYLVWAVLTRFADLGGPPPGFVPIAIETAQGTTARKLAETVQGKSGIWMSALYRHPAAGLENTRFCTAFVTAAFLDHLKTDLAGMIERFTLAMPVHRAWSTQAPASAVRPRAESGGRSARASTIAAAIIGSRK